MDHDPELTDRLRQASQGDRAELADLLAEHRNRLRRMVEVRMDRRLQGRIDPSDVIQEAFVEASSRLPDYLANPVMPFFVWLRFIVAQRLQILHRHHFKAQARDARREVSLYYGHLPAAGSTALSRQLLGRLTSPSEAALRAERKVRLEDALNRMDAIDREILLLRHFEELGNQEAASVLEISPTAASNRYVRALKRLKEILVDMSSGGKGPQP